MATFTEETIDGQIWRIYTFPNGSTARELYRPDPTPPVPPNPILDKLEELKITLQAIRTKVGA